MSPSRSRNANRGSWAVSVPAHAAEAAVRATYRYALCDGSLPLFKGHDPYRIHRTNIEASWPSDVVDLQLSGVIEAKYLLNQVVRRQHARPVL